MKRVLKRVVIPGAALVFGMASHGQVAATRAGANPNLVPARTITGTVFDPSGAPASGVVVLVTPGSSLSQNLKSDASGKFALSWQPFHLVTAALAPNIEYLLVGRDLEHNSAAVVVIDEESTNFDLHLQPGFTLAGSVQDANGAALKTASVRLFMNTSRSSLPVGGRPAAVDQQGAFNFTALPLAALLPQRGAYRLTVTAPGFGSASVPVLATETQMQSIKLPTIKLNPADQRLEGQVVGPDDKPVPGALVRVSGPGQPADNTSLTQHTDANGHFALKVCEGTVRVSASVLANINGQADSGTAQAQAGDLKVVVKLNAANGVPAAVPPGRGLAPTTRPPPIGPLL